MIDDKKECPYCRSTFVGSGFEDACTRDCHFKNLYQSGSEKIIKTSSCKNICKRCNREFFSNTPKSLYCSYGCRYNGSRISETKKIAKANAKWLEDKPRKVNKGKRKFAQFDYINRG